MGLLVFLVCYLLAAILIGRFGARAVRAWLRYASLLIAASLPALLWLALSVRDSILFGRPVFDLVSESGRFAFYVGGTIAFWATPLWLLAGLLGMWEAKFEAKRKLK